MDGCHRGGEEVQLCVHMPLECCVWLAPVPYIPLVVAYCQQPFALSLHRTSDCTSAFDICAWYDDRNALAGLRHQWKRAAVSSVHDVGGLALLPVMVLLAVAPLVPKSVLSSLDESVCLPLLLGNPLCPVLSIPFFPCCRFQFELLLPSGPQQGLLVPILVGTVPGLVFRQPGMVQHPDR